ncbi:DUF2905 domain-containing protein [Bacillus testis]|uniref:DUF2905 domain-containing protein n=1 Tax=Bacillus testis TaxID=1622072 RepID=UPI00067E6F95|nr:DUF2905 domain-containing protein [Bacillus testis]
MNHLGKMLMAIGTLVFISGFLIHFLKLGRLPGDILIKKGSSTFYFPIVTSIIVSVVLSAVLFILGKIK